MAPPKSITLPIATPTLHENKRVAQGDSPAQQMRAAPHYGTKDLSGVINGSNKSGVHGFYSISENLGFKSNSFNDCEYVDGDNESGFLKNNISGVKSDDNKDSPDCDGLDEDVTVIDGDDFLIKRVGDNSSQVNKPVVTNQQNSVSNNSNSEGSISLTPTENYPSSVKSSPPFLTPTKDTSGTSGVTLTTVNLNIKLPKLRRTVTHGFGVKMVATSSCQQLIYRSVPPRPLSYTLTDVLEAKTSNQRSKTAPVSVNSPEDYVQRFKSRPTTRPRVIEFDGSSVSSKTKKMAMGSPGFPTSRAKIYIGHPKSASPTQSQSSRSHGSKIQLAPLEHTGRRSTPGFAPGSSRTTRTVDKTHGASSLHGHQTVVTRTTTKSAGSSLPDQGSKSTVSMKPVATTRETIPSAEFTLSVPRAPTPDPEDHIHNPELLMTSSTDCDDLSVLPRPKKVLPKRELPWVFRYKVKKGMNTLSRIMASKPAPNALHSSYTFT